MKHALKAAVVDEKSSAGIVLQACAKKLFYLHQHVVLNDGILANLSMFADMRSHQQEDTVEVSDDEDTDTYQTIGRTRETTAEMTIDTAPITESMDEFIVAFKASQAKIIDGGGEKVWPPTEESIEEAFNEACEAARIK